MVKDHIEEKYKTKLNSIYYGTVMDNKDPKNRGRCKCIIIGICDTPIWCESKTPIIGGTNDVNGISSVPRLGQHVYIQFINGDIDNPLITGMVRGASDNSPEVQSPKDYVINLPADGRFIIKIGDTRFEVSSNGFNKIGNEIHNGNVNLTGDTTQNGNVNLTGNETITGDSDVSGLITAGTDVSVGAITLTTHTHIGADKGLPTGVPM